MTPSSVKISTVLLRVGMKEPPNVRLRGGRDGGQIDPPTHPSGTVARDISDRKRVERLLIQSEKLAATGRMAAIIAHEINNPLESLMNLVFLARQKSSEGGEVHGYLLTSEGELERVSHIARQTLGFYRDTGAPIDVHLHERFVATLAF
jgi:signal transduction histidine kinase